MVKCVVSGCPNRVVNAKRGIGGNPPAKRFFNFPSDPARVKVWLAALRETDADSAEQHVICEDHFLPEDIHKNTVKSDAIPIMPPCLDGTMGPWGAESSEEEDQWAAGGADEEEEEEVEEEEQVEGPASAAPPAPEPPAVSPPQQVNRVHNNPEPIKAPAVKTAGAGVSQKKEATQPKRLNRQDLSLAVLTKGFLELMQEAPDQEVDIRKVVDVLQTRRRRMYDITNVLEGICLIERQSANRFKWISRYDICSFLSTKQHTLRKEMESMKLVEDTLDMLIKSCAQQLFQMTDDLDNARLAYVTHADVSRLQAFQEQTVIAVRAPEETKLEVPAPKEDSIQVHLKAGKGPITVLACDVGDVASEKSGGFLALNESRIKTTALQTAAESMILQSAVQSA